MDQEKIAIAIDIETTGLEPPAVPVEFGYCTVTGVGHKPPAAFLMNIKPDIPISISTMAVHHITDAMIVDAPKRDEAVALMQEQLTSAPYVAAHNAKFERQWLNALTKSRWIDTWKVACVTYPDFSEHNLQFLRYALKLKADADLAMLPHRAGPDAYICALLLLHFIDRGISLNAMADLSDRPCLLPNVRFGKHIGQKWSEIPRSYLHWVMDNIVDDEDVQFTAEHWLHGKNK